MKEKLKEMKDYLDRKTRKARKTVEIEAKKAYDWAKENPELVVIAAPIVAKVFKAGYRYATTEKEKNDQDCRFWDPRKGRYARSRRKLTRKEEDYVEREYDKGRSYRDILGELGLLQ